MLTTQLRIAPNLAIIIDLLRTAKVPDVLVAGGAVRDTLLNRRPHDIDLVFRLPVDAPKALRPPLSSRQFTILPEIKERTEELAKLLNAKVEEFFLPDGISYQGVLVDLLGLIPATDIHGTQYPDIFVTKDNHLFCAHDELTINSMSMDLDGTIRPTEYAMHLRNRLADFQPSPHGLSLFGLLRALRFCGELDLRFSPAALENVMQTVTSYQWGSRAIGQHIVDYGSKVFPTAPPCKTPAFFEWVLSETKKYTPTPQNLFWGY